MPTFIGDVHGWIDRLDAVLAQAEGEIVLLGDLIDRGPAVPEVLDRVHDLYDRGLARCVLGNHEWMLARVLGRGDAPPDEDAFDAWVDGWGGDAVMAAFGVDSAAELKHRLGRHWPWLGELPWVLEGTAAGRKWVAIHAGFDHQRPFAEQLADVRAGWDGPWSRSDDPRPPPLFSKRRVMVIPPDLPPDVCLISGHTPVIRPLITAQRIACDTTGGMPGRRLTGIIWPEERIISSA